MKSLLTALSVLTIGTTAGNLVNLTNKNIEDITTMTNNLQDINQDVNYHFRDSYNWWRSDSSNTYTLLNWKHYASDWNTFTKITQLLNLTIIH